MPPTDLLTRELRERELHEDPGARAARVANQRWITHARLWAAIDRAGITEPGEQAAFICERLWPDLRPEIAASWVEAVRVSTRDGRPLRRPLVPRDVVGDEGEQLLARHGYLETSPHGD